MTPPSATLILAKPSFEFYTTPGTPVHVATSGATGAGTIKLQYKVTEADAWVDDPSLTFATDKHIAKSFVAVAVLNRITVTGADGTTAVNVQL